MKTQLLFLLFFSTTIWAFGQANIISGRVYSSDDDGPLPGVNILIKDSSQGTVSDFDGNFSIPANPDDILVFSFVGYNPVEIKVGNQTSLSVNLDPDIVSLSEVVVIGYGETSEKKLTTAVTSLDAQIIENKPFVNIEQSINGKAPGVQVIQPSGRPGAGISIRIRGATSVTGGNEPLYVVDGVPVLNTEGINPSDVESIDILKDAASASIYGARAANGVVLITTKRGNATKPTLNFSSYVGFESVTNTIPVLNSEQYMDLLNTARLNAGLSVLDNPFDFEFNTDWQQELYDPASIQNYQLAFSGGSEDGTFFVSAGYQNQEGVIAPSDFERFSVRFNQDRKLLSNLKVGNSIALSHTTFDAISDNQRVNNGGVVLSALTTPPIIPVRNADGTYPLNPYQAWENPIALVRGQQQTSFTNKVLANVYAEYTLPMDVLFKSSVAVDYNNSKADRFVDPFTTGNGRAQEGEASNETFNELIWVWENTLNYHRDFGEGHNIDLLLGTSFQQSKWESTYLLARGFANGSIPTAAAASEPIDVDARIAEWSLVSHFIRGTYNYKNKYLLSASMRADGSSRFGDGNRYGYFPSASVGWNISEEDFLDDISWLNNLKLRYSFGITGNQNIGNYSSFGTYGSGANYPFDGEISPGIFPDQVNNEDLRWESTTQHNIGVDADLFGGRISAKIDVYHKRTSDMLLFNQLPNTTGYPGSLQNIGSLENKGLEIGLNAQPVSSGLFTWNVDANISFNRSKVLEIGPDPIFGGGIPDQGNVSILQEGQPIGNFYGWVAQGVDNETGNIVFLDRIENGIINDEDRQIIGNALPDFTWGITNRLAYGGIELTIFLQGVQGQDIYNATRFEMESMSSFKNQSTAVLDRWTPENTEGSLPQAVFGDPGDNDRISTRWVEDGSFLKIRELTLAYNLPSSLSEKFGMQNAKVYVQGRNFYTLTDYSGYDPEVSRDGGSTISPNIDYGTYPQVQSFLVGLNISF
ncbi:TonB-dependent receptor [Fulvivirga sp. M361]|uniref:SusC/RagA family TonB-linked outer membrane protein n=1 Tax=Fulvivirga sp. M361 TaxID=2594266 RepID=UPI00117B9A9E|nr:TonB-dependent receptor [Fulvivirga sp. M361]TRX53056.1 TonB-dependent receptor [Fulvivirga sp. M361]